MPSSMNDESTNKQPGLVSLIRCASDMKDTVSSTSTNDSDRHTWQGQTNGRRYATSHGLARHGTDEATQLSCLNQGVGEVRHKARCRGRRIVNSPR